MVSPGAGLAHRQTNALHYKPIYLISGATLSTAQHTVNWQRPGFPKSYALTHTQTTRPARSVQKQSFTHRLTARMSDKLAESLDDIKYTPVVLN